MTDCDCCITKAVFYIGLLFVLQCLIKFAYFINRNFVRKGHDVHERYGKDSWIAVTGATSGIGKELCLHAAKEKGLNVVIIGRNPEKLKATEAEVKKANPKIKTKTYRFDFNDSTSIDEYQKLSDDLKDLDISIFVNNAGLMPLHYWKDFPLEAIKEITETNIHGLSLLTKIFTERFYGRDKRSAIVNVASTAGYAPIPLNCHYGGSKAYVRSFTKAVGHEVSDKIDVLCFSPGYVDTALSRNAKGYNVASPEQCSHAIFRDLGYERETQPNIVQENETFSFAIMLFISEWMTMSVAGFLFKQDFVRFEKIDAEKKND
ncbi:unnamed protein product [Moneuplotes crassus]|uniref:Uncharacterized protein n=1 Tax=Euplotes crassus TaxID=5936 RepID=A0AAD1XMJ3_EUPCR|nr:unnamed protein product [Moneuplotes crassus]